MGEWHTDWLAKQDETRQDSEWQSDCNAIEFSVFAVNIETLNIQKFSECGTRCTVRWRSEEKLVARQTHR